jgi:hypothetical protein
LIRKAWVDTMPGGPELASQLASQLGVGRMMIEAALSTLESEGLLVFFKLKSADFVGLTLRLLTFDSGGARNLGVWEWGVWEI